ncbi:DUF5714 domain-containing protein [Chloroflexota bacterium]
MKCVFCGLEKQTNIYCQNGHYICDECHERETLEILGKVIDSSSSKSPLRLFELIICHPSVQMHGPEHHAIVPAVVLAAIRNSGYAIPEGAIEQAIQRGAKIPGGWCGYYGACGAAIGVGVAISVLTRATPLTGKERTLSIEATTSALNKIQDSSPRCCKRASRKAIETAIDFLKDRLNIVLDTEHELSCKYSARNRECITQDCTYFPSGSSNDRQ